MADELSAVAEPIEQIEAAEPNAEETAQPVEGEAAELQETADATAAEEVSGDGRTLPKWIKDLKQNDPQGFENAKRQFFAERDFAKRFPGGLKEVDDTLAFLAERGGREGIQQIASEVAEYRQLSEAMTNGDVPAVLNRLTPEFIAQAAPEFLGRFEQEAPEACNKMLCQVVDKSINDLGIPQQLFEATLALRYAERDPQLASNPIVADLKAVLTNISQALGSFGTAAQKPLAPRQQQPDTLKTQREELARQETAMIEQNYTGQMVAHIKPVIEAEAKSLGYDLTPRQLEMLHKEVFREADKAVGAEALNIIRGHLGRKNVQEAVQTAQSRYGQVIKDVVKREAGELFRMPTKPKPAVAAPAKPAVVNRPSVAQAQPTSPFSKKFAQIMGG